jgi:hypothetical protein
MTPRDAAPHYAERGWPVFPCKWQGLERKKPLTTEGWKNATTDFAIITAWWTRWPAALIAVPTGEPIGLVVLDVDMKHGRNGFATLAEIDCPILPATPTAHTATDGGHLYFLRPEGGLRNTAGNKGRGIGPGLDWRGDGGYVIVPSPGSGYRWDRQWNFRTCEPIPVPKTLLPKAIERVSTTRPVRPTEGLSRYAEAALDDACRKILAAPAGSQEATLNGEAWSIGTLAGAGGIPPDFARRALLYAARQIPSYDPRRLWSPAEIERKVNSAFDAGLRRPREVSDAA